MKALYQSIMETDLKNTIKCFLCKCTYDYADQADKKKTKPELLLQNDLQKKLEEDYQVERNFNVKADQLPVQPSLNESVLKIDFEVKKENKLHCFIEVKYDEEYMEGKNLKCTHSQGEEEILRDAYKLQCLKKKYKNALCLVIFATNKSSHWEKFVSMPWGEQTIIYNGKEEKFYLESLTTTGVKWHEARKENYRYCIIEI